MRHFIWDDKGYIYIEPLKLNNMSTQVSYYERIKAFRVFVTQSFPDLIQLKKEDDRASFNEIVLKIMPDIRRYVNGRLNTAIQHGHFSKGKYKADDFIDQLFIEIYDSIEEVRNEDEFFLWLYKKTNDLLEDVIVEEEFDDLFFKNIADYTQPEWDEMQEKYTVDGGGDFVMVADLEDASYNHNDYTLNHVFVEDKEQAMIEKIDQNISKEALQSHIKMVLHNLPMAMRNVFDLATNQLLELDEIAHVRNISASEVEQLLADARKAIQVSLFNRYK